MKKAVSILIVAGSLLLAGCSNGPSSSVKNSSSQSTSDTTIISKPNSKITITDSTETADLSDPKYTEIEYKDITDAKGVITENGKQLELKYVIQVQGDSGYRAFYAEK